jgi:hypothetical protein
MALVPWQDLDGGARLSVVVKATCDLRDQELATLAEEQIPVAEQDEPFTEDPQSSLRIETDRVPFKPCSDVILVGKAHAPEGRLVQRVDVGLRVGPVEAWIRVIGDRSWSYPNKLAPVRTRSAPEPFETMDLVYERAFGGIDSIGAGFFPENPAGRGYVRRKKVKAIDGMLLPNLEDPHEPITSWRTQPRPVGFGFYPRNAQPRLSYAGTYDDAHLEHRAPALPRDFSHRFFNAAHPDLQVPGYLQGEEEVELTNLTASGRLRTRLPGLKPRVTVDRIGPEPESTDDPDATEGEARSIEERVETRLDTLVLLPEEERFYMVYRGVCRLRELDVSELAGVRLSL